MLWYQGATFDYPTINLNPR